MPVRVLLAPEVGVAEGAAELSKREKSIICDLWALGSPTHVDEAGAEDEGADDAGADDCEAGAEEEREEETTEDEEAAL